MRKTTIRKTAKFWLYRTGKRYFVRYLGQEKARPAGRRVSKMDAQYLDECNQSFDAGCVELGVAVFQNHEA